MDINFNILPSKDSKPIKAIIMMPDCDPAGLAILCPGLEFGIKGKNGIYAEIGENLLSDGWASLAFDLFRFDDDDEEATLDGYNEISDTLRKIIFVMSRITKDAINSSNDIILDECSDMDETQPVFPVIQLIGLQSGGRFAAEVAKEAEQMGIEMTLISPKCIDGKEQFQDIYGKREIYMRIASRFNMCPVDLDVDGNPTTRYVTIQFFNEMIESTPTEKLLDSNAKVNVICQPEEIKDLNFLERDDQYKLTVLAPDPRTGEVATKNILASVMHCITGRDYTQRNDLGESKDTLSLAIEQETSFLAQTHRSDDEPGLYD